MGQSWLEKYSCRLSAKWKRLSTQSSENATAVKDRLKGYLAKSIKNVIALKDRVKGHLADFLALFGLLAIIVLIAAILLSTPLLTKSGPLSSTYHTALVVAATALATLFSGFVASRLRYLLLQHMAKQVQKMLKLPRSGATTPRDISRLDRKWRGILGIDSVTEKVHNLPIVAMYLFSALMTTAIVATFTPISIIRKIEYHPVMPGANYAAHNTCAYMVDGQFYDTREYSWSLPNGSHFFVPANAGGCPTRFALTLAGDVNPTSPQEFAYSDMGVAVQSGAIGAPGSIYSSQRNGSPELENLLQRYGTHLLYTTQCVPVMNKTPFRCGPGGTLRRGGTWNVPQDVQLTASSAYGDCTTSFPFYFYNVTSSNLMLNFFCPASCPASGDSCIGKGTMVLSGWNTYGYWLASSINDLNANDTHVPPDYSYVITCQVDATDVFSYRKVKLDLQGSRNVSETSFGRVLSSTGEECEPVQPIISNILFATAAAANWQLLDQNKGDDGLFDSLAQATGNWRNPPYAFSNSRNPLEDALGLIAALVVSRVNNSGHYVPAEGSEGEYAYIQATRLGSGRRELLLLLIPPIVTAIVLTILMIRSFQDEPAQDHHNQSEQGERGRQTRPVTASLIEMIRMRDGTEPAD